MLGHELLRRYEQESPLDDPVVVRVRGLFGSLVRIGSKVEQFWHTELDEWFHPDCQRSPDPLLEEHELPVVVAKRGQITVIGHVEEVVAGGFVDLPGQVLELVMAVEMNLVLLAIEFGTCTELFGNVGYSGGRQERDEPV